MAVGIMDRPLFIAAVAALVLGTTGCTAQVVTPEENAAAEAQTSSGVQGPHSVVSGTGPVVWNPSPGNAVPEPPQPVNKAPVQNVNIHNGATNALGQPEYVR